MQPAEQRFGGNGSTGARIHDRLKTENEWRVRMGGWFRLTPRFGGRRRRLVLEFAALVKRKACAFIALRHVHCSIGVREQLLGARAIFRENRNSDARGNMQFRA